LPGGAASCIVAGPEGQGDPLGQDPRVLRLDADITLGIALRSPKVTRDD